MRLTKDQRFTAYCIMLHEIESNMERLISKGYGFCWLSRELFGIFPWKMPTMEAIGSDEVNWNDCYPELFKKKPMPTVVWFDINQKGMEQRIKLLKQCILETHP